MPDDNAVGIAPAGAQEVVIEGFTGQGANSLDLDVTTQRLMRGGSWKKQRVFTIIPGEMVPIQAAFSWWNMVFPPNQQTFRMPVVGMEVGDAYSQSIDMVLAHPKLSTWEYILTVEIDNIPPPDGIIKLIEAMEAHPEFAAISGAYYTKGERGVLQAWGNPSIPGDFTPQLPRGDDLVECNGIGMGFALWRMSMFKDQRLKRPLFRTVAGKEGAATQDLVFWRGAKEYGYRCAVLGSCRVGHIDYKGDFGPKGKIW
jgi:hypothetical protein